MFEKGEEMNTMKLPYNEISIWGTGGVGKRCYLQLKDNYNIKCFYDNNLNQKNEIVIDNIKKEDFKKDESFIVIASSYWKEIMEQLKCWGLCLFRDFIPSFMIDNSVVIRILKLNFNNYEINTYIKNKQGNEIIDIVNNPNFIDSADILNHCEDSIKLKEKS
jgi:hypothetical protein